MLVVELEIKMLLVLCLIMFGNIVNVRLCIVMVFNCICVFLLVRLSDVIGLNVVVFVLVYRIEMGWVVSLLVSFDCFCGLVRLVGCMLIVMWYLLVSWVVNLVNMFLCCVVMIRWCLCVVSLVVSVVLMFCEVLVIMVCVLGLGVGIGMC